MIGNHITERIANLLAMAEHPGSNRNEAAIALEKAQALLLKHNLSRADIIDNEPATPAGIGQLTMTEEMGFTWKRALARTLANANLCQVIGSPSKNQWHVFGSYDNVRAVVEMFNWVAQQLVFMANREYREYKNDEGTERGQTWKLGYYQGAIQAIKDRLQLPLQDFTKGIGRELVLVNTTNLDAAVHRVFPRLTTTYSHSTNSRDGRSAGREAGRGMTLTPAKRLAGTLLLS